MKYKYIYICVNLQIDTKPVDVLTVGNGRAKEMCLKNQCLIGWQCLNSAFYGYRRMPFL